MPSLSRLLNFALAAAQRSGVECLSSGSALLHVAAERVSPECRRASPPPLRVSTYRINI